MNQKTKVGLSSGWIFGGVFLVGFKVGLPNETHKVFWVCAQVYQP